MEKNKHATGNDMSEVVGEARESLAAALESAREAAGNIRDKAVAGAKATNKAVRAHPYKALAIGIGVGLLIGFLAGRRNASKAD